MTPNQISDAQLVVRCRSGDEAAWAELVERFSRYVFAIAGRVYRLAEADAEDVFQETFARAYEHLPRLREDDAIRPWIAQLARRLCVDRLRAAGREQPTEELETAAVDESLERLAEALTVRDAMGGLSGDCQDMLDRFFCRDQSYRTIGAELEIPSGTIASRISRCLVKLREAMDGRSGAVEPSSDEVPR